MPREVLDKEFRAKQAALLYAKQMARKEKKEKSMDPWECFVRRKVKSRYPW